MLACKQIALDISGHFQIISRGLISFRIWPSVNIERIESTAIFAWASCNFRTFISVSKHLSLLKYFWPFKLRSSGLQLVQLKQCQLLNIEIITNSILTRFEYFDQPLICQHCFLQKFENLAGYKTGHSWICIQHYYRFSLLHTKNKNGNNDLLKTYINTIFWSRKHLVKGFGINNGFQKAYA